MFNAKFDSAIYLIYFSGITMSTMENTIQEPELSTSEIELLNTPVKDLINTLSATPKKRGRKSKNDNTDESEVKEKKVKEKKVKPPKNFGFIVPSTRDREYSATRFCKYIFDIIKESKPELLSVPAVVTAYNELFTYMSNSFDSLVTYLPSKANRYNSYKFTRAAIYNSYNPIYHSYNDISGIYGTFKDAYLITSNHYNSQAIYKDRIAKCRQQIEELTALWSKLYNLTYPEMSEYLIRENAKLQLKINEESLKKEITSYKQTIVALGKQVEDINKQIESYKSKLEQKEAAFAKLMIEARKNTS